MRILGHSQFRLSYILFYRECHDKSFDTKVELFPNILDVVLFKILLYILAPQLSTTMQEECLKLFVQNEKFQIQTFVE